MIIYKMKSLNSMNLFIYYLITSVFSHTISIDIKQFVENFKVFTVATNETDGFKQFMRSSKIYNIPLEVIGLGTKWKGGDMTSKGGGFKVNLLKEAIKPYSKDKNTVILFTDRWLNLLLILLIALE
ncbi:hypothetical protein PGB90_003207 [Kerria lacca]